MAESILITGATGNVGSEVFNRLLKTGALVRGTARSTQKAFKLQEERGGSWVAFDFTDPSSFDAAFDGVKKMFLMRPPALSNVKRDLAPALHAANKKGVSHIAFLSLQGVEHNRLVPHRAIEDLIRSSGMQWTMLRPSFFMQNLSTTHREEIKQRSEIYVPAGIGKTSFIDIRDIADVAVKVLTSEGHSGAAYELTGNEALSYSEVADILSKELGRTITYKHPGILQFLARKMQDRTPLAMALVMTTLYSMARLGKAGSLTDATSKILGKPPISFRQFAHDFRAEWI